MKVIGITEEETVRVHSEHRPALIWCASCSCGVGVRGISQWAVFQILAGILHIGNIQFSGTDKAAVSTPENLQWAGYLLELEPSASLFRS